MPSLHTWRKSSCSWAGKKKAKTVKRKRVAAKAPAREQQPPTGKRASVFLSCPATTFKFLGTSAKKPRRRSLMKGSAGNQLQSVSQNRKHAPWVWWVFELERKRLTAKLAVCIRRVASLNKVCWRWTDVCLQGHGWSLLLHRSVAHRSTYDPTFPTYAITKSEWCK